MIMPSFSVADYLVNKCLFLCLIVMANSSPQGHTSKGSWFEIAVGAVSLLCISAA